jgi:hypothetical protein
MDGRSFTNGPGKPPLESTDGHCRHYRLHLTFVSFIFPHAGNFLSINLYVTTKYNTRADEQLYR